MATEISGKHVLAGFVQARVQVVSERGGSLAVADEKNSGHGSYSFGESMRPQGITW